MNDKPFTRYLTEKEERTLFATVGRFGDVYARRDHAWLRLLRQTGIRVGTLAGLNFGDARAALQSHYLDLRPEISKRGQGGRVFLTKKARKALADLMRIRREMDHPDRDGSALIYSRKHARMSVRSFEDRFRHWAILAGLSENATPHWLRHTLAKRIMQSSTANDPRGVVQATLGHRSIASTSLYTRPDREEVEFALEEAS